MKKKVGSIVLWLIPVLAVLLAGILVIATLVSVKVQQMIVGGL